MHDKDKSIRLPVFSGPDKGYRIDGKGLPCCHSNVVLGRGMPRNQHGSDRR